MAASNSSINSNTTDISISVPIPNDSNANPNPHLDAALHCCCGRVDCALLKKNRSILETVERDVHTAAQLGQALLARHEAYMAEAEKDRLELTARIERLEMDKQELEAENAVKIEENRNLLDHLEMLNSTVCESDTKIKTLEASLISSQQCVRRLESAADRAADAERHLLVLEQEQAHLQELLKTTQDDARSHSQRCKEAQRDIFDLQDQLERIEAETQQERERHAEVVARMERQREVEKHLDAAANRLKGAAATKTITSTKSENVSTNTSGNTSGSGNSSVVGHFVRDLLQDNASLQLGIAELRELLLNAHEEVETMREQLMCHQPMPDDSQSATTLKAELESPDVDDAPDTPKVSQELHIHHHYHVTPKHDRKPKKKRLGLAQSFYPASYSGSSTPLSNGQWHLTSSPTAPAVLSMAGDSTSSPTRIRQSWSVMSDTPSEFASSVPSSPRSNQRNSVFDTTFTDGELPTSPATTFDPTSPCWRPSHRRGPSDLSIISFRPLEVPDSPAAPLTARQHRFDKGTIQEVDEEEMDLPLETPELAGTVASTEEEDSATEESEASKEDYMSRPRIHRAVSHESIMSLTGGLDIHTLKARPGQMAFRPLGGAEAVVTVTGITAQPTMSRGGARGSAMALRDNFASIPTTGRGSSPSARSASSSSSLQASGSALGKLVGWRPWGGSSPNAAEVKSADRDAAMGRAPGINQPGVIPGFQKYWAGQKRKGAPAKVTPDDVDREALNEGLQEQAQES